MSRLIFLIVICLIVFNVKAQEWEIGPEILMSSTFISTDLEYDEQTSGSGINAGIFGRYLFNEAWYLQLEALYGAKSTSVSSNINNQLNDYKLGLKSIDFNLLAGYNITKFDLGRFHIFAGPGYSKFIDSSIYVNGDSYEKGKIKSNSWNIHAGAGLDISILSIMLRYQHTLTDLTEQDNNSLKLNSALFGLGIKLL
ncbi:porin family protein [Marinigracilibium pacificum]|uniref:PorT family protein n=1 Tax=Marinigracilibium pacificum TaxID=2729599 RepID=A0A848IV76_9BACT|nr:porin family protein [Marinigracilibium pacificum]NMM48237.1 PorT family protein [Marinigracilibium pacificum]